MLVACLLNFGLLYVLKYWNFTADLFLPLADRAGVQLPLSELVLPLGVSFFMFQSVGYVIDVYRRQVRSQSTILGSCCSSSPSFRRWSRDPSAALGTWGLSFWPGGVWILATKYGIQLMLWGYFKKLVIADRAAVLVSSVLDHPWDHSGSILAVGVLFYCIQLYGDFSGGIDITRAWPSFLASTWPKTSAARSTPRHSRIFGGAGTSPWGPGCGTISSIPSPCPSPSASWGN